MQASPGHLCYESPSWATRLRTALCHGTQQVQKLKNGGGPADALLAVQAAATAAPAATVTAPAAAECCCPADFESIPPLHTLPIESWSRSNAEAQAQAERARNLAKSDRQAAQVSALRG